MSVKIYYATMAFSLWFWQCATRCHLNFVYLRMFHGILFSCPSRFNIQKLICLYWKFLDSVPVIMQKQLDDLYHRFCSRFRWWFQGQSEQFTSSSFRLFNFRRFNCISRGNHQNIVAHAMHAGIGLSRSRVPVKDVHTCSQILVV